MKRGSSFVWVVVAAVIAALVFTVPAFAQEKAKPEAPAKAPAAKKEAAPAKEKGEFAIARAVVGTGVGGPARVGGALRAGIRPGGEGSHYRVAAFDAHGRDSRGGYAVSPCDVGGDAGWNLQHEGREALGARIARGISPAYVVVCAGGADRAGHGREVRTMDTGERVLPLRDDGFMAGDGAGTVSELRGTDGLDVRHAEVAAGTAAEPGFGVGSIAAPTVGKLPGAGAGTGAVLRDAALRGPNRRGENPEGGDGRVDDDAAA